MTDSVAACSVAEVAGTQGPHRATDDWTRQRQFGMSFEEQQEVLYRTLMAFQEPEDELQAG